MQRFIDKVWLIRCCRASICFFIINFRCNKMIVSRTRSFFRSPFNPYNSTDIVTFFSIKEANSILSIIYDNLVIRIVPVSVELCHINCLCVRISDVAAVHKNTMLILQPLILIAIIDVISYQLVIVFIVILRPIIHELSSHYLFIHSIIVLLFSYMKIQLLAEYLSYNNRL